MFPGAKAKAPLSNMAMLELLRGMDGNGSRFTASDRLSVIGLAIELTMRAKLSSTL